MSLFPGIYILKPKQWQSSSKFIEVRAIAGFKLDYIIILNKKNC